MLNIWFKQCSIEKMTCVLEQELQSLLEELKAKQADNRCDFDNYQNLVLLAVRLRSFDIESKIVDLSFFYSGEESELYLRIKCLLLNCPLQAVIDSKGHIRTGDFEWDDSFVCRLVKIHENLTLKCWQNRTKFVCDSVFDIWKRLISEGVVRMDL